MLSIVEAFIGFFSRIEKAVLERHVEWLHKLIGKHAGLTKRKMVLRFTVLSLLGR